MKQTRKKGYKKTGQPTTKLMSFKIDIENVFWLEGITNKGRYINKLIQNDRIKENIYNEME